MLMFVLDELLFKFQYDKPAFVPLFQLPSNRASAHSVSLYKFLKNKRSYRGEAPGLPKEQF
jgi:hypothetical protein